MSRRDRRLLWEKVRLAVVDIETVFDSARFSGAARDETDAAIAKVKADGAPVRLAPQKKAIRWGQHALVEAAGLASMSHGIEPGRAVEVMAAPDGRAEIEEQEEAATRGGEHRAAWIAVVTYERGKVTDEWSTLVNPGVPVDRESVRYHNLTNGQLRPAPAFARIADRLEALVTPAPGEILVLVGHNVGYDIGVLRGEMRRIGREIPDVQAPALQSIWASIESDYPKSASMRGPSRI